MGPGRSPGPVKPDVVYFGGDDDNPLLFIHNRKILKECGTSFSAPALATLSGGVLAHFGDQFTATTIRAILVYSAEPDGHPRL